MKANRIAMLGLAVLLGSTVYGNVSVIKAENNQLEEGLDAIEDAIGKGKDSDSENNSQSALKGETDMQEGSSDNTIGTPDDFPAAYDFGSGKISDFSRNYMLKKMPEPEQNDTVLNTDADPDNIQVLYLWEEGNIPAKTKFTKDMTGYFDDWDFRPYVTAIPVRKGVTPKGAVVLMAGGAYQFRGNYTDSLPTAAALREYGFQTFIVDYRLSPYTQEEGALDVARAVRFIRKNADVYGIDPDDIAVMGFSSTINLFASKTIFTMAKEAIGGNWYEIIAILIIIVIVAIVLILFLGTRLGLSIRATGDNPFMVRASSISPIFTITVGLCVANAMTGLSGGLLAQYQRSCDINIGTGQVTIALASLIIGETLVGKGSVAKRIFGVILGSCLYRFIVAIALRFNVPAECLKLVSSIIVAVAISLPYLRQKAAFMKTKRAAMAKRKQGGNL